MARPTTGTVEVILLSDGTKAFHLRFSVNGRRERNILHERDGCECGCGGGWDERSARTELGNIRAKIRAGVWRAVSREPVPSVPSRTMPTFHEYASRWLGAKIDGSIGERPIDASTQADYRWRLSGHLLPYFARYRLDEIDRLACLAFKSHKLAEAAQLREALEAGADIRDRRGRRAVPLGPSSVRKLLDTLAAILDDAIEDELLDRNPARGRRMRIRVAKPARTFLEMDELVALIDAARDQDAAFTALPPVERTDASGTRAAVAKLHSAGLAGTQIAAQLGIAKSTVSYHLRRLALAPARGYIGRRAVVEILGRSGLRASELCDLRIGSVRLHDRDGARLHVLDAKTEAGIREVQLTPDLAETLIEHIDQLRRAGHRVDAHNYVMQNVRGGRLSRQRVGEIVSEAATVATEAHVARGLPPLPHTTPHSLRRTYISIALLANNFDVKWVMSQVGHADSKMTLDVYAQLEQRAHRSHGSSFDRLVRDARRDLDAAPPAANEAGVLATNWPRAANQPVTASFERRHDEQESTDLQGLSPMARPRLELGTPRFSEAPDSEDDSPWMLGLS